MRQDPNKAKLFFLHIPKTAGTTLHSIIIRNYTKDNLYTWNAIRFPNALLELDKNKREKISVFKGHFPYGVHTLLTQQDIAYFTLLRNPTDRVISHYNQLIRSPNHHFYQEWAKHQYTLLQLLENGKLIYLNNMMVRMISGKLNEPWDEINDAHLHLAIQNLEMHFPIVGIQEQFDEFLLLLCQQYGWRFPYYRKQQVLKKTSASYIPDENTRLAIKQHNQLDEKLYAYVQERFNKQLIDAGPDFPKKVIRFKKTNTFLQKIIAVIPFFPPPRGN